MAADHFTSTDALIFQAIIQNDTDGKGASLSSIVGFADYINHAILTYEEMNGGITRLIGAGLIQSIGKRYSTTVLLKPWRSKFKKLSINKEYQEIAKYLSSLNVERRGLAEVTRQQFEESVKNYLGR